jgi:hypothetical protein
LAKGKAMKSVAIGLGIVIVLSIGTLVATSSGVLIYQVRVGNGYFCHYFTGTATLTTLSSVETGCPRLISV